MPTYQRMVSYLYEYRGGERGGNVGYVRLEIREDVAKMIFSIRLRRDVTAICPVEFYYWKDGQAYGVPAGDVRMNGGRVEERLLLPGVNMGKQQRPATQMSGLRILLPQGYLGSAWDDELVPMECVEESERAAEWRLPARLEIAESLPEEELQVAILPEEELQMAILPEEVVGGEMSEMVVPEQGMQEVPSEIPNSVPPRELTPDYFFHHGPRMCPFEDPAITQCVRMEPSDLEYLPREAWVLGSNSFLLHGYYTYGHLILARMRGMGQECVILGVPGLNQNRERFLARLFGFEQFKPVARPGAGEGEFGYWYMVLPIGN